MIVDRSECEIKFLLDEETQKKLEALEIIENELQLKVISQLEGNEIKRYIQYLPYFAKEIDFETFELLKEILK